MKRVLSLAWIGLTLAGCSGVPGIVFAPTATPAPVMLTDEQMQSLALCTDDLPGYIVDSEHTGLITYDTLQNEGSIQTAAYVNSVDGLRIYRSAFERAVQADGPSIIWSWVLVYRDDADARGYFVEHTVLYPEAQQLLEPFPDVAQQSTADYTSATLYGTSSKLYHVIMRQQNIVIYFAPLYDTGILTEADVQKYAQLLESRLLKVTLTP